MKDFLERFRSQVRRGCVKQPANGFTLVELMVVVACIAILAAAATPALSRYLRLVHLRQAVYQISGDLYTMKSEAIKYGANRSITFDNLNQTYTLVHSTFNQTMRLGTYRGVVVFTKNPDPAGTPDEDFSNTITFNSRGFSGLALPVTTQVYVTNQDNRIFRIQVTATGAVSVRIWDIHENNWDR